MFTRAIRLLDSHSFFLFGARGTGKSTLLDTWIPKESRLWIDLLQPDEESTFLLHPTQLSERIGALPSRTKWVVIDEVQKAPKLLDVVHYEIERRRIKFALTGSSARKLKRGGANLLAGRAFVNHLFPLTSVELGNAFRLSDALAWGTLPAVVNMSHPEERKAFLKAYVDTFLKEEVAQEQLVRNMIPFRRFLPIASQLSGTLLNYNSVAHDVGVDWTTVRNYFDILEDTLLGFLLPPYHRSLRKQQLKSSKFYLFDVGVKRALDRMLDVQPTTGQLMGPLFEHWVIGEIYRLNHYQRRDYALSHFVSAGGLEVDLVVDRPGQSPVLVEIKSTTRIADKHLRHLRAVQATHPEFEALCLCREKHPRQVGGVRVLPWRDGLQALGLAP
jgi:predicted AAA+ superfamily ATPase